MREREKVVSSTKDYEAGFSLHFTLIRASRKIFLSLEGSVLMCSYACVCFGASADYITYY